MDGFSIDDQAVLAKDLSFNIDLRYQASGTGDVTDRRVTVRQLRGFRSTVEGQRQVTLIVGLCHLRRQIRHFLLGGVEDLVDPETGEVATNISAWLLQRAEGPQLSEVLLAPPPSPPQRARRARRRLCTTFFKDGMADGWVFGVPAAFKQSLDISSEERLLTPKSSLIPDLLELGIACHPRAIAGDESHLAALHAQMLRAGICVHAFAMAKDTRGIARGWFHVDTEGAPADYDFSEGDTFYDPPEARKSGWTGAPVALNRMIQVTEAYAGRVAFDLTHYVNGDVLERKHIRGSQRDLAWLLETGEVLGGEAPADE